MSDSTSPRKVIHDSEFDNLISAEQKTFDGWMERLTRNGPSDQTAAAEVAASAARYNHLERIKRGYLS
jgi:hypothetical protein